MSARKPDPGILAVALFVLLLVLAYVFAAAGGAK